MTRNDLIKLCDRHDLKLNKGEKYKLLQAALKLKTQDTNLTETELKSLGMDQHRITTLQELIEQDEEPSDLNAFDQHFDYNYFND